MIGKKNRNGIMDINRSSSKWKLIIKQKLVGSSDFTEWNRCPEKFQLTKKEREKERGRRKGERRIERLEMALTTNQCKAARTDIDLKH